MRHWALRCMMVWAAWNAVGCEHRLFVFNGCHTRLISFDLAWHCYSIPSVWQELKECLWNEERDGRMLQFEQLCGTGSRQRLSYLFFQSGTCSLIYTCPKGMAEPGQRGEWCQAPSKVQNQSFLNLEEKKKKMESSLEESLVWVSLCNNPFTENLPWRWYA